MPYAESCSLAAAPLALVSYHVDTTGMTTTAPAGCDPSIVWQTAARPAPSWPGPRSLVVSDGLGHEVQSAAAMTMLQDVAQLAFGKL